MDAVLRALAASVSDVVFGRVHADQCPKLAQDYQVTAVPTFVLVGTDGSVVAKIEGSDKAAEVTQAVQRLQQQHQATSSEPVAPTTTLSADQELSQRLDRLIRSSPVMLFMKGTPDAPRCGFSRQMVELLASESMAFGSFDILSDEQVRQGLKKHSNWPTYPQLYVGGELIGGLDIVQELKEEGSLREQWGIEASIAAPPQSLEERLSQLIRRSPVMLFMKGLPSAPRCGFSRQMVEILDETGVAYDAFDILEDEAVRHGLKTFSNWPTYPQLYVKGELIGGLDIVKELKEDGSLKEVLCG